MRSSYLRGLNMASFFGSSKIIVFVTFTAYTVLGNTITASTVFVTVSLYGTIKLTVTLFFALAVEKLSETLVSIRRIKVMLFSLIDYGNDSWHDLVNHSPSSAFPAQALLPNKFWFVLLSLWISFTPLHSVRKQHFM